MEHHLSGIGRVIDGKSATLSKNQQSIDGQGIKL
jgi:hypothetical protein